MGTSHLLGNVFHAMVFVTCENVGPASCLPDLDFLLVILVSISLADFQLHIVPVFGFWYTTLPHICNSREFRASTPLYLSAFHVVLCIPSYRELYSHCYMVYVVHYKCYHIGFILRKLD